METLTENAKRKLEEFADKVISEIQYNIKNNPVYKGKPANASGRTAASLAREWAGDTLIISGAGHIFALEFGRKPTMNSGRGKSLRESIREWMDDKPVATSETPQKRNSIAWLITRGIHKSGTLLYQSGRTTGTLRNAISEEKIVNLGKELLGLFAVNAVSTLLQSAKE